MCPSRRLIAGRRKQKDKATKDREQAVAILAALQECGEQRIVDVVYQSMPKPWQKTIKRELTALGQAQLLAHAERR